MSIPDLQKFSLSETELVLPFAQALEVVTILEKSGIAVLGWEGWLLHSDGKLGHSARHQGTATVSPLSTPSEYAWLKKTMEESHVEHLQCPEIPNSQLLFCITLDA